MPQRKKSFRNIYHFLTSCSHNSFAEKSSFSKWGVADFSYLKSLNRRPKLPHVGQAFQPDKCVEINGKDQQERKPKCEQARFRHSGNVPVKLGFRGFHLRCVACNQRNKEPASDPMKAGAPTQSGRRPHNPVPCQPFTLRYLFYAYYLW
jgi:hypothetical protein